VTAHIDTAGFEARYRDEGDPWGYETSDYEREKYAATLAACGTGPFERALELGASIGVFSALLAPRCRSLETIDAAPTAVAAARGRLAGRSGVSVREGEIPSALRAGPYDLVVASEILYYLEPAALDATLDALRTRMAPGGRLVAVHWRPPGPERPFDADQVHARLMACEWLSPVFSGDHPEYRLDVLVRA
jgi:SAM-dependent methyltransferase